MSGLPGGATPDRAAIEAELLAWMAEPRWRPDEARFDRLARALFAWQFAHCPPYRRFCEGRGATPDALDDWRAIPAVPTGAFKELALRTFPEAATIRTFRTSGTTGEGRGALHLDTLALYEASLLASLRTLLLPDLIDAAPGARAAAAASDPPSGAAGRPAPGEGRGAIEMIVLAPSADEVPDSSLSHMFEVLVRHHAARRDAFAVRDDRLDPDRVAAALERSARSGAPIVLLGTAFSFVHLLDAFDAGGRRFACPPGSRLMETGGFKGRAREVPREVLHERLADRLGLPRHRLVNQYGMTELGSQFYDSVIVDPDGPRRKLGPPWVRVRLLDPETRRDVAPGEVGMVVIHDLANTGSVAAIETADLGRAVPGEGGEPTGFEVIGRDPGAEARGCSIAADAMLSGVGR